MSHMRFARRIVNRSCNIKTFHKTGGVTSVRCDVGIVNGKSGPYSIAIMAKDVKDDKNIDLSLARISEAVYHFFN